MKLTKNNINIESIEEVLSLYYQTERSDEDTIKILVDSFIFRCTLESERNRLYLASSILFIGKRSAADMLWFCNKMNRESIMLKLVFTPETKNLPTHLTFAYDIFYASELNLSQMTKALANFITLYKEMNEAMLLYMIEQ